MAAGKLNEAAIKALPIPERGNKVHYLPGAVLQGQTAPRGFGVRVTAGGAKAFVLNYRIKGVERRITIGQFPTWSALRAVREANVLRRRIDMGENPLDDRAPAPPPPMVTTVADVVEEFIKRHVRSLARPLRSATDYEYALRKLVVPAVGKVDIYALRRSQVADMLDKIADEHGPVQSDRTLAYFRKCLNWRATRDDDFVPPIAKGMARTRGSERARDRVLSDDEIRLIWPALAGAGIFGALVKTLLLTAQRRGEVSHMCWSELDGDTWTIPASKYKTARVNVVPLSDAARAAIEAQPKASEYVFSQQKGTPFRSYGRAKEALDDAIAAANDGIPLPGWTLHDLRRTAKTLMVRAGVRPDISERVLGHVIAGIEAVYDRHNYAAEKREALERLAAEIKRIINPPPAAVAPLNRRVRA